MNTKNRFASLAMMLVMAVMGNPNKMWADQQVEFQARQNKMINGFEAELRGDYREKNGPSRLNAELEKINLPAGTAVTFCVSHSGVETVIGTAVIKRSPEASIELEAEDGDFVPKVVGGDILEAHQKTTAPFVASPTCTSPVLISAPFLKK